MEIRPVGKRSPRRDELVERGGRMMVPYLIDPNTGIEMYESNDIVAYLYATYGDGNVPTMMRLGPLNSALSFAATALRPTRGLIVRSGAAEPAELLELWSMESSPWCRKVREAMTTLDLRYILHNVPKGAPSRAELEARGGKVQVPYLHDPNTPVGMYKSDDIVAYLFETYGAG